MSKSLNIEEFRELIHNGEASDPLIFLESVMNGQDPRLYSEVYQLAIDIDDFSGGCPSPEDWAEIFDQIRVSCKYMPVSLSESTTAAKTIAEYLHAKRKQIETKNSDGEHGQPSKLTKAEIRAVLKIYEGEF